MKNLSKLIVIGIFALFTLGLFISQNHRKITTTVSAQTETQPTPPATNTNVNANVSTNTTDANTNVQVGNINANASANANADDGKTSDKKIPKDFTLGQDSFSEYGEVAFNHDSHAFKKYSPDGTSVVGCVECHHTDQPKSALKPPLLTSERDILLTLVSWQKSSQKVSECRSCHFQDGEVPEDKEMPIATYKEGDKDVVKELNNELAYHINCNTCHDAAAKLRPEVKKTKGFATTNDCMVCHKEN